MRPAVLCSSLLRTTAGKGGPECVQAKEGRDFPSFPSEIFSTPQRSKIILFLISRSFVSFLPGGHIDLVPYVTFMLAQGP